jgi:restriction system protein
MPVLDYQSLMLPFMKTIRDKREHAFGDIADTLAKAFRLTEAGKREILPSGIQTRFDNRVGWARTYLKKAGLLESAGRGKFRITERGIQVLNSNPASINVKFIRQFPEFIEFQKSARSENKDEKDDEPNQTPEESLETSYQNLRRELAQELLDRIKNLSPKFFERLVVDLLVAMGYGGSRKDAGQAVGQSSDGGIDGIIKEDKLGLDAVYIQAKRWENTVGRPVVQAFAGSLEGQRARKGVFITTSQFSQDAKEYVNRIEKKIVLIDGEQLAQLMIAHGIGVTEIANYVVKKVDLDCFGED